MRNIFFTFTTILSLCCGQHNVNRYYTSEGCKNNIIKDSLVQDSSYDDVKCIKHLIFLKEKLNIYDVNYTIQYNEKYFDDSTTSLKAPIATPVEEVHDINPFSINLWKQVTTEVERNLTKNHTQIKKLFTEFFIRENLSVPKGRITILVTILNDGSLSKITFRLKDNYVMAPETGIKLFKEFDNSSFFIPWKEKQIKELFFAIPIIVEDDL